MQLLAELFAGIPWQRLAVGAVIALGLLLLFFGWLAGLALRRQEREGDEQHFFDHH